MLLIPVTAVALPHLFSWVGSGQGCQSQAPQSLRPRYFQTQFSVGLIYSPQTGFFGSGPSVAAKLALCLEQYLALQNWEFSRSRQAVTVALTVGPEA